MASAAPRSRLAATEARLRRRIGLGEPPSFSFPTVTSQRGNFFFNLPQFHTYLKSISRVTSEFCSNGEGDGNGSCKCQKQDK